MSDTCMNHIESYWKILTLKSNKLFESGSFSKALKGYTEALYRAEVLNNHRENCVRLRIPFIQVYLISCNNIANTQIELSNLKEAEKILSRAIHYLLYLLEYTDIDKQQINSELRHAVLSYTNFTNQTNYHNSNSTVFKHLASSLKSNH